MNTDEHRLAGVTESILRCAFRVSNGLGSGFLEKIYENALAHELVKAGHKCLQQHRIGVHYDSVVVGEYVADLLVDQCVMVELKAVRALDDVHAAQCLNYLKATGLSVCLLLNFGNPRLRVKRLVF
jgi:GxxExxY protein